MASIKSRRGGRILGTDGRKQEKSVECGGESLRDASEGTKRDSRVERAKRRWRPEIRSRKSEEKRK
jgi:hypothetical protein